MKNTIVNVESTSEGRKVTYSNGTVRTYHGRYPQTVHNWILEHEVYPQQRRELAERIAFNAKMKANPTNIESITETADGRFAVKYYTGRVRTFKRETLPNTAYRYWDFMREWAA